MRIASGFIRTHMRIKAQDSKAHKPYKMRASHALANMFCWILLPLLRIDRKFLKEGAMDFFSRGRGGAGWGRIGGENTHIHSF